MSCGGGRFKSGTSLLEEGGHPPCSSGRGLGCSTDPCPLEKEKLLWVNLPSLLQPNIPRSSSPWRLAKLKIPCPSREPEKILQPNRVPAEEIAASTRGGPLDNITRYDATSCSRSRNRRWVPWRGRARGVGEDGTSSEGWRRRMWGGGLMPRHWRSGWQRMWPKRAFCDQNLFPHSLQGAVMVAAERSGFFLNLGVEGLARPTGRPSWLAFTTLFSSCHCGALPLCVAEGPSVLLGAGGGRDSGSP